MINDREHIAARSRSAWTPVAVALACLAAMCPHIRAQAPIRPNADRIVALEFIGVVPGRESWGLDRPEALAVDHRGRLLIADTGNHRVLVVSAEGEPLSEFGGYGWEAEQLDTPSDLAVLAGISTYVLDEGNRRVSRFDVGGDFLDTVVPEDSAGTPVGLALGRSGDLLLVDSDSQSVLTFSQFSEALEPVGQFGAGAGALIDPRDVDRGPGREMFVADAGRHSIEIFDEFGSPLRAITVSDTMTPEAVLCDGRDNIIVCDVYHGRVLVFSAVTGRQTARLDETDVGDSFRPVSLARAEDGTLLVLDGDRGRVLLVRPVRATAEGR